MVAKDVDVAASRAHAEANGEGEQHLPVFPLLFKDASLVDILSALKYAQEKIAPVRTKALDAIKTVAKEKGYTYVIDEASSSLLVMPPGDDLLPAVKTKLGIKDAPQAPAGTRPAGGN